MKDIRYILIMSTLVTVTMLFAFTGCGKNGKAESDKGKVKKEGLMPYFSAEPTSAVLNLEYTYVEFGRYPQTMIEKRLLMIM